MTTCSMKSEVYWPRTAFWAQPCEVGQWLECQCKGVTVVETGVVMIRGMVRGAYARTMMNEDEQV